MQFQYETEIEFNGELCSAIITLQVNHYEHVKGSYSLDTESDWDYYGYEELDYDIKSIEVIKHNGSTFHTNSKNVIDELISEKLYGSIYDWLLDQMRN